jgi:HSP20 family protein
MAVIRWEPARELQAIQQEMNRLFGSAYPQGNGANGATASRWIPPMDVAEDEEHFVLRADLPGVEETNVNVELEDNVLTISGERKSDTEERRDGYHRIERAYGTFSRSLTLPEGIDPEAIGASFSKGVLEVRIAKPEQRKPRKVAISVGDSHSVIEGSAS